MKGCKKDLLKTCEFCGMADVGWNFTSVAMSQHPESIVDMCFDCHNKKVKENDQRRN